jgi:hypothetical protein
MLSWSVYDATPSDATISSDGGDRNKDYTPTDPQIIKSESEKLLKALGYSTSDYKNEIHSETFTAVLQLEGEATPTYVQFFFYEGKMINASGTNVVGFSKVSDAPTVSAFDAVERLNDYRWYAMAPFDYNQQAIAYDAAASASGKAMADCVSTELECNDVISVEGTVEPTPYGTEDVPIGSGDVEVVDTPIVGEATDPSEPTESPERPTEPNPNERGEDGYAPMPEKTIVKVTDAKLVWVMVEAADGKAYFVRGWSFYTADNKEYSVGAVIALPDGVIKFKEVEMIPMGRD